MESNSNAFIFDGTTTTILLSIIIQSKYIYLRDENENQYSNKSFFRFLESIGELNPYGIEPKRTAKNKNLNIGIRTIAKRASDIPYNTAAGRRISRISSSEVRALLLKRLCLRPQYFANRVYIIPMSIYAIVEAVRQISKEFSISLDLHNDVKDRSFVELVADRQYYCLSEHRNNHKVEPIYLELEDHTVKFRVGT